MSWCISLWVYLVWDPLGFMDLGGYFFSCVREVFDYNLLKYFLIKFLFLFFFSPGTLIIQMLVHLRLSQRSLRPSSISVILFLYSVPQLWFLSFCLTAHYLFYLSYSTVDFFESIYNFSNYAIHHYLFLFS